MLSRLIIAVFVGLFTIGCMQAPKATFEVQIINETDKTISVGLVKDAPRSLVLNAGRPLSEDGWAAPEDIERQAPQLTERHWGELIPPKGRKVLGPKTGEFPAGLTAVLRVYTGDHSVDELLAVGRSDADRLDVSLWPGRSSFVITEVGGRLTAKRGSGATTGDSQTKPADSR